MAVNEEMSMTDAQADGEAAGSSAQDCASSDAGRVLDNSLLEAIPASVAQIDANGCIVAANLQWLTLADEESGRDQIRGFILEKGRSEEHTSELQSH